MPEARVLRLVLERHSTNDNCRLTQSAVFTGTQDQDRLVMSGQWCELHRRVVRHRSRHIPIPVRALLRLAECRHFQGARVIAGFRRW